MAAEHFEPKAALKEPTEKNVRSDRQKKREKKNFSFEKDAFEIPGIAAERF